jgi:hypothetical protein
MSNQIFLSPRKIELILTRTSERPSDIKITFRTSFGTSSGFRNVTNLSNVNRQVGHLLLDHVSEVGPHNSKIAIAVQKLNEMAKIEKFEIISFDCSFLESSDEKMNNQELCIR